MHLFSYTMTDKFSYYTIRVFLAMCLDGESDITQSFPMNGIFYSDIKSFLGYLKQFLYFGTNLTYTKSISRIPTKTIHQCTTIDRYNISIFQWHIVRNTMHNLFVNRGTKCTGKRSSIRTGITFESRDSTVITNELLSYLIQLSGCNPRLYQFCNFCQSLAHKQVTLTQKFYFIICLKKYHLRLINTQQHYVP